MGKLFGLISAVVAAVFGYIAFTREWNTAGDFIVGTVCIGFAALFAYLAFEALFNKGE